MTTSLLFRPLTPALVLLSLAATASLNATAQISAAAPALAGASSAVGIDVPTFRGDNERTGYVDCSVSLPLSVAWQNTTTSATSNLSSPTIHSGVIFFGAGGTVYALNEEDGSVKWKYPKDAPTASSAFDSPATIADGKVFIGNDDGNLYVLDEKSGASLWQVTAGTGIRSAPAVDNGTVFFGSLEGKLYAIREDNQQPLWGGEFRTLGPVTTAPIVSNGVVYFADGNDTVYAATEATGRLLWSEKFDYSVSDSSPLVSGSTLYVGSDRSMFALTARSGAQKWRSDLQAATTGPAAIAPDGGLIYVPTADGNLTALTASRGIVKWIKQLDSVVTGAPAVARDLVVVVSKAGIVTGIDPITGSTKWLFSLHGIKAPFQMTYSSNQGQVSASPLIADGSIYTLGNEGTLTAFQAGAIDELKPEATLITPKADTPIAGSQVPYQIAVTDAGSGINPSTLTLKVDGKALPMEYLPTQDEIRVKEQASGLLFGAVPVALDTLTSGPHLLTLRVSDWHGNRLVKSWSFTVDSSLNPPDATPPPPASATTPDTSTDTSSDVSDNSDTSTPTSPSTANSTTGGAVASTGASAGGMSSSTTPATSSGDSTSHSSSTSAFGNAATTTTGTSSTGGGSTTTTTPAAPPVAPPPAVSGGFPPPPPI